MIIRLTKRQLQDVNKRMAIISFELINHKDKPWVDSEKLQREQDLLIEIQKKGYLEL